MLDGEAAQGTGSTASTDSPVTRHSLLSTLLGLALVAAIAGAIFASWNNPQVEGRIRVRQAYGLLDESRYTQATNLLEQTLLTYAEPEARLALSYAYLARHDWERAERQARLVIDSGRLDMLPAALNQLGRVLQVTGRVDEAHTAWNGAVEAAAPYPNAPRMQIEAHSARWHIAMLHWARGEWDAARTTLEQLAPGGDLYAHSARLKLAQLLAPDDPEEARQLLDSVRQVSPSPTPSTPNTGLRVPATPDLRLPGLQEGLTTSEQMRLQDSLRAALEAAGGSGPDDRLLFWGSTYLQQGERRLARLYLERAVEQEPESARAHAQLGLALFTLGEATEAVRELETAARLDPDLPLPHDALAQVYMQRGEWQAALREIDTLQRLQPTGATPLLLRGEYHRLRGEYDEAEDAFFQAAAIQKGMGQAPGEQDAQLALAHFYIDVLGQGCSGGLGPAQESVAAHPDNAASLDAVGWAFALCGRLNEALSPLEKAVTIAPDNPRYRYHLGRLYVQLERFSDAREQYARVLDFDPSGAWSRVAITEMSKLPPESGK